MIFNKNSGNAKTSRRCGTGIVGLDSILQGGLPCDRLYVIEGEPGSGKTTMALQFLLEGAKKGERSLYVSFSETKEEMDAVAESHGWDLSTIVCVDLSTLENQLTSQSQITLFHPSEIELNQITEILLNKIQEISPSRIVFDSVSEMRLLAESPLRYRKQILSLKRALAGRKATVFFLDDLTAGSHDMQVQSIAHGVLRLSRLHHSFGGERRQVRVLKLRGVNFQSGSHDMDIVTGGIEVYPRLISNDTLNEFTSEKLQSGIHELDALLGGGLDRGTSNLFIGPAGTGKSSLSLLYALAAVANKEKVAFFSFDETISNLLKRSRAIGMKIDEALASAMLHIQKVNPAELSPGAFAALIQSLVLKEKVSMVVIDSLNGYIQAMPQEQFLTLQLHELLAYLNNLGIITIMTLAQPGMIGVMSAPVDLTYLADTVILTRFFEFEGAIKKAISVIKKRTDGHETSIREFTIGLENFRVGPELKEFQGILNGIPRFHGESTKILKNRKEG